MAETMMFPATFDEFAEQYGFKDKQEVYTNGSDLIPIFRVRQWLDHIGATDTNVGHNSEWISVKERLPEIGQSVLVYASKYYPVVECRDLVAYMKMGNYTGVTHWMPLPEPPKGE